MQEGIMSKYLPKTVLLCAILCLIFSSQVQSRAEQDFKLNTSEISLSPDAPAFCIATHNVGKIALTISNYGVFGTGSALSNIDCFSGSVAPSCEYPKGSDNEYLFIGAFWIGAVVGNDTLVSVGADGWQYPPWPTLP